MARDNLAYDLARFEARPAAGEQTANSIKKVKKTQNPSGRVGAARVAVGIFLVLAVTFALLFTRVQLTECNSEITQATAEYTKLEAAGTQMSLQLEGLISPKKVQEYAENELGMVESSEQDVEYVRLTQDNKIEVPEQAEPGLWEKISSFFAGLLS